jgi:GntR family transcriptional repressor for pyruvate dehydrogenase complex
MKKHRIDQEMNTIITQNITENNNSGINQDIVEKTNSGNNQDPNYKKTYEYVFDYFSSQILSGQLRLNDKIPPERDIAAELGVSRNSVREVIHILEISGLIESVQGSGNYIRCNPQDFMVKSMNMLMTLQDISYREILDLRCAYEYTALRLAVENITPEELNTIRSILEKMDQDISPKDSAALDVQFHNMLLIASRNRLLHMYTQTMSSLLDHFIHDFRTRIMMDEDKAAELRTAHWDIYHALAKGDYNAGVKAMDQHFKVVNEAAG